MKELTDFEKERKKKTGQLTPPVAPVSVLASCQWTGGSALQLCGSYLSQGGSEQIGANDTARVCFVSQHAAEAWAPHHRRSLAFTPVCFMLECRPGPQSLSPMACACVAVKAASKKED